MNIQETNILCYNCGMPVYKLPGKDNLQCIDCGHTTETKEYTLTEEPICPVYGTAHRYTVPIKWKEMPNGTTLLIDRSFPVITKVNKLACPCLTASKEIG